MQIEHRTCFKCHYEAETANKTCPRCGRSLFSETNIRIRGALLVACGTFLIGLMGAISSWVFAVTFRPETAGGARFTGSESDLLMIAGVFGFVILFGLIALIAGLWQLIFGRRNLILVWAIVACGIIFIIGGEAFVFFK